MNAIPAVGFMLINLTYSADFLANRDQNTNPEKSAK